jgi:hypothetical protein
MRKTCRLTVGGIVVSALVLLLSSSCGTEQIPTNAVKLSPIEETGRSPNTLREHLFTEEERVEAKGLMLTLRPSGIRFPAGSQYRLDVIFTNRSKDNVVIWAPWHRFEVQVVDTNCVGKRHKYYLPQSVSTHDFAVWQEDIIKLAPGAAKTLSLHLGRNIPGTVRYRVKYRNLRSCLEPQGQSQAITDVWAGELISKWVGIEFHSEEESR